MSHFLWLGVGAGNVLTFATGFFWSANTIFLFLLIAAWKSFRTRKKSLESVGRKISLFSLSDQVPPVSILVPAHNEESVVLESVSAFLTIRYPHYEVIVINDGSEDGTLERLQAHFELEPASDRRRRTSLSASSARGVYRSKKDSRLTVIDKPNSGKADSLNLGIDFSEHEIFCAVDADSIPEVDSLAKTIIPFIESPNTTVASGGSIRVFNGCTLKNHKIESESLPRGFFAKFQVVEYVRAFFCARVGWNFINSTILIPGAFGLFKKSVVIAAGGYQSDSVSEDLELVVRLHRICREIWREEGTPYSISYIPDPVCWTLVPEDMQALYEQRRRWQRGMVETLFSNLGMFLNPRYGALGMFAIPYYLIVEVIGPVIEVLTYACVVLAYFFGFLDPSNLLLFVAASLGYGTFLTLVSIALERQYHSEHRPNRSLWLMAFLALAENFGYRQLQATWRTVSLFSGVRTEQSWRKVPRTSF